MSKFVDKIIKESYNKPELNELFGFSANEKAAKVLGIEINKAREEASKYDPVRLVGQPGGSNPDERNRNMQTIVAIRIKEAGGLMPTLKKLVPRLFTLKPNSTNAATVKYKDWDNCIIPSEWYFITGGKHVLDQTTARENFMNYVNRELGEIMQKNNIKQ